MAEGFCNFVSFSSVLRHVVLTAPNEAALTGGLLQAGWNRVHTSLALHIHAMQGIFCVISREAKRFCILRLLVVISREV